jgi:hypothetical protein
MHTAPQLKLTLISGAFTSSSGGNLIWLSANLLASSRQGFLHSTLRARLQVEGVTLHFLNDVFRLNLALEPAQGILDRLTCNRTSAESSPPNQHYISALYAKHLSVAPHPTRN